MAQRTLEDPVSGWTHLAGAIISVVGLLALIDQGVTQGTAWHLVAFSIFGASLVLLYTASSLYHLSPQAAREYSALRTLDHCMIFILIAGTYTPFCLIPLRGPWGFSLLASIWGIALLGIGAKIWWPRMPRRLSTGLYVLMGWLIVIAIYPLAKAVPPGGIAWLLAGGLCYSGGAIIYNRKRPNISALFGYHPLWHLCVLAGSLCHFWAVWRYLAPLP